MPQPSFFSPKPFRSGVAGRNEKTDDLGCDFVELSVHLRTLNRLVLTSLKNSSYEKTLYAYHTSCGTARTEYHHRSTHAGQGQHEVVQHLRMLRQS